MARAASRPSPYGEGCPAGDSRLGLLYSVSLIGMASRGFHLSSCSYLPSALAVGLLRARLEAGLVSIRAKAEPRRSIVARAASRPSPYGEGCPAGDSRWGLLNSVSLIGMATRGFHHLAHVRRLAAAAAAYVVDAEVPRGRRELPELVPGELVRLQAIGKARIA